ncbi:beta-propeller fold lactonase family protein [Buchnera aphidicola (Chaitoregma tattakana)]|uniref:beta-propeller fold lactonase family protein n=1 Tax=Buchnera aphidicola TaxID=9 RepID=UPI0031B82533
MKKIIYVSLSGENVIKVLQISKKMEFIVIQKFKTNGIPQPIYIYPKKKLLYLGIRPNNKILVLKILENGMLKFFNKIDIKYPSNHININFKKKILFSSSFHGNCLEMYKIDENCIPYKKYNILFNIKGCHFSSVTKNNKLLIFSAIKEDRIYYSNTRNLNKIDKSLCSHITFDKNSGPRHFVLHKNKKNMYVINELNSTINVIKIDEKMKILQKIKLIPNTEKKFWASEIEITPCNKYLYASDRKKNVITSFKISNSGDQLKLLKFYKTDIQPRSFRIDSSGNYLVSTGEKSNSMSLYKININNGQLIHLIKNFFIGKNPIWVNFYDI